MNKNTAIAFTVLACVAGGPAAPCLEAAPAVPRPGDSLGAEMGKPAPEIDNQAAQPAAPAKELHFTLRGIRVDQPETRFPQKDMDAITAQAVGHEITVKDLDRVLSQLSAYGRSHGYPAAYAFVPEQRTKNGVLEIRIALGRFGKVIVEDGAGKNAQERAKGLIAGLRTGEVIKEQPLETALVNVNNMYGVNAAGKLIPGASEGTSDLIIKLSPGRKQTATIYSDNYGSKASGRYRYGFQAGFMDLGETGGRLTVGGLISNSNMHNYNIGWDMQLGHSGTNVGIRYSRMDYELGDVFSAIDARGIANTTSLYAVTPLWHTVRSSLAVKYGFDYRDIKDELQNLSAKKHSYAGYVGLEGTLRNPQGGGMHASLTAYTGTVGADSDFAYRQGEARNSLGRYTKGVLDTAVLQRIGHTCDFLFKFQGQLASRNLDSSEQMYVGGIHGVRAYPTGTGSGDEGCLANMELRYHTPVKGLMLRAYYDVGRVRMRKDGVGGSATLQGWGIGVTYTHSSNWFARLDYARRIGLPDYLANDDSARSPQRMWFLLGKTI